MKLFRLPRFSLAALVVAILATTGCAARKEVNPATLRNWVQGKIDDETYYRGRQQISYYHMNCKIVLPELINRPVDMGYPSFVYKEDLKKFNDLFPQFQVTTLSTQGINDEQPISTTAALLIGGLKSEIYSRSLEIEVARLNESRLPLTPGKPSIHEFMRQTKEFGYKSYISPSDFMGVQFRISAGMGTGSLIKLNSASFFLTAAHVLSGRPANSFRHDIGIIGAEAVDTSLIPSQRIFFSDLHPTASSKDLLDKELQIYFFRDPCKDDRIPGQYLKYTIIATEYDSYRDQLHANVPSDLRFYMGGVSGAGVYLDDKLVGIFLGDECLDKGCLNHKSSKTAYLRFVGIDTINRKLEQLKAGSENYPLLVD